jgi:1-acyl-sn-glycerol-3-phosphate acyltransferase
MVRFFYIYKKKLIRILKIFIRAALWLFCVDIHVKNKYLLKQDGPLLIIANHPNSFLDAIIIGAQYHRRIYFLARGDAFTKKHHRYLLGLLNMIPVYRLREGKQYLHLNEYAFNESVKLLKKGEAVLIFIEGVCINSHQLQPFKKGASRILSRAHEQNIFPKIHIAGIAYNQLKGIGKRINICITEFILSQKINCVILSTPKEFVNFNQAVFNDLQNNIHPPTPPTIIKKNILYFLHLPYYNWLYHFTAKKTKNTVFFDSVLFSLLLFTYPIFIIILFLIFYLIGISLPIIFGILLCILLFNKYSVA